LANIITPAQLKPGFFQPLLQRDYSLKVPRRANMALWERRRDQPDACSYMLVRFNCQMESPPQTSSVNNTLQPPPAAQACNNQLKLTFNNDNEEETGITSVFCCVLIENSIFFMDPGLINPNKKN
jgi:hypothetical protein